MIVAGLHHIRIFEYIKRVPTHTEIACQGEKSSLTRPARFGLQSFVFYMKDQSNTLPRFGFRDCKAQCQQVRETCHILVSACFYLHCALCIHSNGGMYS